MTSPLTEIRDLNLNRYGSAFNLDKFKRTFFEEVDELMSALKDGDIDEALDGANDSIVVLAGLITQLGYDPHNTLAEVVKHITDRKQDPEQAERWSVDPMLRDKEKWRKDLSQPTTEIHQPDFQSCKL